MSMSMFRKAHHQTIFHLRPIGPNTKQLLHYGSNSSLVSEDAEGELGFEVGYHIARPDTALQGGCIIADMGRNAAILLPNDSISRVHAQFCVHPESRALMFKVTIPKKGTVLIRGYTFRKFHNAEQIVLFHGMPYEISFQLPNGPFQFKVVWLHGNAKTLSIIKDGFSNAEHKAVLPALRRTPSLGDFDIANWYQSRIDDTDTTGPYIRDAHPISFIGAGSYGVVSKAIDMDSGHFIALKKIRCITPREQLVIRREVETLKTLKHHNILEYLGCKENTEPAEMSVSIFSPLKAGSVHSLFPIGENETSVLNTLLFDMLCALDYIAYRGLIHRDVKPDNIFYTLLDSKLQYHFQLADFGLANFENEAKTQCGTPWFKAPELVANYSGIRGQQTPKLDIWALVVSILDMTKAAKDPDSIFVLPMSKKFFTRIQAKITDHWPTLEPMGRIDPSMRASAAQMLGILFDGKGATTERANIGTIPLLQQGNPAVPSVLQNQQQQMQLEEFENGRKAKGEVRKDDHLHRQDQQDSDVIMEG